MVNKIFESQRVTIVRDANGDILIGHPDERGFGVVSHINQAEWRDFLRAANADAAQFHYDRGPYKPEPTKEIA